jgi:hypothetical protein
MLKGALYLLCGDDAEDTFSKRYTLSNPLIEGVGQVSRSDAAMTTFWLALANVGCGTPSQLMAVAMALARAWALVRSNVTTHFVLCMDLR